MVAVLTPKSGGKSIVIDKAVVLVGRHPDCDYILQNSRKVSRRHVCIVQVNEKYMVRDLGSMNGVTVNGTRVKKEQRVVIGDEVVIGDVPFRFEEVQKIPRPARKPAAPVSKPARPGQPPKQRNGGGIVSPMPPSDISQQYPVALPDEDQSFEIVADDDEPMLLPDPVVVDEDEDVGFIALDEDIDAEPEANVKAEDVQVIDVGNLDLEELDIVDTIEEVGSGQLGDSFGEFGPVVDMVEEFGDDDVEDVIVLDDPIVLDDDDDEEMIVLD